MCDFVEILPLEVSEEIFKYLSFAEIMSFSLVSSNWYRVIGASLKVMDKVVMKINCQCKLHDVETLMNSSRKYQRMAIREDEEDYRCGQCHEKAWMILQSKPKKQRKWKAVEITRTEFETTKDAIDFLKLFEKTVEWLLLREVKIDENTKNEKQKPLRFPKLKELHVSTLVSSIFFDEVFPHINTLKRLTIFGMETPEDATCAIIEMLRNNKDTLTDFNVDWKICIHVFGDRKIAEMNKIQMKLDHFVFMTSQNFYFYPSGYYVLRNLKPWGQDLKNVKKWQSLDKQDNIHGVYYSNNFIKFKRREHLNSIIRAWMVYEITF